MQIISEKNPEKAKQQIKKITAKPIVITAQDDIYNRKMLEYGNFDILLSPEKNQEKDRLKQFDSGLNHVLAKIAAKNNIAIGIDLEEIQKLGKEEKAKRIARIRQNIRLCRKAKARIKIISAGSKEQAMAFLLSLGASTQQAKEAITF